ncbi:hypothetical protein C8J55DRAFT_499434, partial [Lentinula edodes]
MSSRTRLLIFCAIFPYSTLTAVPFSSLSSVPNIYLRCNPSIPQFVIHISSIYPPLFIHLSIYSSIYPSTYSTSCLLLL